MKIHKALNPRGAIAKEMEIGLRRAIHLERLCELWLMYHQGDRRVAALDTPYVPPPHIGAHAGIGWDDEMTTALSKAYKGTELWEWQRVEAVTYVIVVIVVPPPRHHDDHVDHRYRARVLSIPTRSPRYHSLMSP